MKKRKKVLTTGQTAKLFGCAPRTISKWFDSVTPSLKGYRLDGSKDRRIYISSIVQLMTKKGMTEELEELQAVYGNGTYVVMTVALNTDIATKMVSSDSVTYQHAATQYKAGMLAKTLRRT